MSVVVGEAFHVECIHNKRPKKELVPATIESNGSVSSPDDVIGAKMEKPDGEACASHPVPQNKAETALALEEPVKKKRGRKPLPPELRAKKHLKTPKALPRQPKPSIKKPLPGRLTRSSREILDVLSGQSSRSSGQGQGVPQAAAGSPNVRQKTKKGKELPVELRDKIVERHKSGEGYKKISKSLNISSSTVRSIIRKWKVHRTTETLPRSGCPSKLSNQARSRLVSEATVRPTVTLKELKSSIAEMGEIVSESTISRSLHKAGLYCTVELVPVSTESSSSVSSPDDDIGAKMVKPDGEACASHLVPQNKAETVVALEEPVKKKRGRKPLPPELRVIKLLKTPKALPRQPKPSIKKPFLPGRLTRTSRDLLDVLSGQSSSSSGQGAPQASAGSSNGQKKSKKSKELPVELKDTIVQRHISGEGYKTISKSLNISSSTIGSIIRKWKVHRTTETLPRSGCPSKLSNQARNRLVSEGTVRPTVTLKELKSSIAEMGENVSESAISRSLHKAGLYCTVDLVPLKTESSISVSSPGDDDDDDDISAKMVKLDGNTCASDTVLQTKEQTAEAKEEPVKKRRGRKPLPPELRVKKLLKTASKALPRQPKPSIKKPLLPDSFTGITRSSRNLLDVPSGQSSSSSGQGQGTPHASAGSPNGQQKAKKGKELPVELRDKIVERHKSGEGYKKISKSLNISSSTVRSIILKWKVHHTTETLPRSGCPSKLSNQARSRLVSEATVRPTVTLKELKSSIAEMGENVSESTISRSLHKAGLYCKVAKRKVQIKERCLMQSQQDVSSSQHHPCSEVLWWEHYVKDILRESNNEASQE